MATPSLPAPRAVIFDLDGTLVDTVEARIQAWLRTFAEEGIPASHDAVAPFMGADGRMVIRTMAAAAGMKPDGDREEAIDRRSGEIFEQLNADPTPLPGARDALRWLTEERLPFAIATSSRPEQVGASLLALRLPATPIVVDGLQVARAKPAPDLLLQAAHALHVDPQLCWYVGDATWDMRAARAAGMTPIGVPTGTMRPADLEKAGAHAVIGSLAELPGLVKSVLRPQASRAQQDQTEARTR